MSEIRPVYIKWLDSTSIGSSPWTYKQDALNVLDDDDACVIRSIGFIVAENERLILIAMGESDDQFEAPALIPKACILEMYSLEIPQR